jgi:hypothetical protein
MAAAEEVLNPASKKQQHEQHQESSTSNKGELARGLE